MPKTSETDSSVDRITQKIQNITDRTMAISVADRMAYMAHGKFAELSKKWITHLFLLMAMVGYTLLGGVVYSYVEGGPEDDQVKILLDQRNDVMGKIQELVTSGSPKLMEKSEALIKIYEGQLMEHFGKNSKILMRGDDKRNWDFWGSAFFCGTIYTTIGYGHIVPLTTTGRGFSILYALLGVPLFLTVLADFGKLFTRWVKYIWLYVRRIYYTGSCRKPRRMRQISETEDEEEDEVDNDDDDEMEVGGMDIFGETGDDFSLPISLALSVFLIYLLLGAVLYYLWEHWTFFESCYFVFISMATIGFGDFVPQTQYSQMSMLVYLVFGLALTSMCINVVREKLTETFTQASAKLGQTVGIEEVASITEEQHSDTNLKTSQLAARGFNVPAATAGRGRGRQFPTRRQSMPTVRPQRLPGRGQAGQGRGQAAQGRGQAAQRRQSIHYQDRGFAGRPDLRS